MTYGTYACGARGCKTPGCVLLTGVAAQGRLMRTLPYPMNCTKLIPCLLLFTSAIFATEPAPVAGGPAGGRDDALVYKAATPDVMWNGWGYSSPLDPAADPKPAAAREQFDIVPTDPAVPRTFSGKVVGPESMKGVEVGIVSLEGIHWNKPDAYQWSPVGEDGTFSVPDMRYPDASKAIAVRGPGIGWTFLRRDFGRGEGAENIVLKPAPAKKVRLTASGEDMTNLEKVQYEAWPAVAERDDAGHALRRQRLGPCYASEGKSLELMLPVGRVALFVHCKGWASFYQVVDTSKGDHIHFVLQRGGQIRINAMDAQGAPKVKEHVTWINYAAPLSLMGVDIKDGTLLSGALVPGKFQIDMAGTQLKGVEVMEGYVTEIVVQDGREPVVSQRKAEAAATPVPGGK